MLDGKYEITSERELGAHTTLFMATAPDGTALRITWYDLEGAEEERDFEHYRLLLRELRRESCAAIYDLVARPGAYYVAWHMPESAASPEPERLDTIRRILQRHGRALEGAQVCADPSTPGKVFDLPFKREVGNAVVAPSTHPATPANPVDNLWISLTRRGWAAFRPWAVGAVLALLGVFFVLVGVQRSLRSDLVSVPDVRGEPVRQALERLYRAGFSTEAVALESSRTPGTVIDLNPGVDTLLRPGRTLSVSYALSAGRAPQTVPSLVGKDLAAAQNSLQRAGFELGDVARVANRAGAGTVVAQAPSATAEAVQGAAVQVLLSTGPAAPKTFLPDLSGLGLEDALTLAEAAGFPRRAISQDLTEGTDAPAGTVLDQNLKPFIGVPLGALLRLSVAAESTVPGDANETPDLIGLSLAEAQLQARNQGLSVVQAAEVDTPELPPGIVLQRPAPGAALQNRIDVTVNQAAASPPNPPQTSGSVRRAEYSWLLGPERLGARATVTVTTAAGSSDVLMRDQRVTGLTLSGVYLTTASGPLTFSLTLDGQPYGSPLVRDP